MTDNQLQRNNAITTDSAEPLPRQAFDSHLNDCQASFCDLPAAPEGRGASAYPRTDGERIGEGKTACSANDKGQASGSTSVRSFDDDIQRETQEYGDSLSDQEIADLINNIAAKGESTAQSRLDEAKEAERIKRITSTDLPIDYHNAYADSPRIADKSAACIPDGLVLCLEELGRVDIDYISAVSGRTPGDVIFELSQSGTILQNPKIWAERIYMGWETADEYLSGNLYEKYKVAAAANQKYRGHFERNLAAIQRMFPEKTVSEDIYITLGSPWIPPKYYNDFVYDLLKLRYKKKAGVEYDTILHRWFVRYLYADSRYNTAKMSAIEIIERTLNNRPIAVFDITEINGKRIRNFDKNATVAALEQQKIIIATFKEWVRRDPKQRQELEELYYEKYGAFTARKFNGSFLRLVGINPQILLYPHQKDAIARIIFSHSTLLAHAVGTGKTYIMIAAGMEMRRIGVSRKNMYVVPNSIVRQWEDAFRLLYPAARVLVCDRHNMLPARREETLKEIKNGEDKYDAIIISYGSFELIKVGKKTERNEYLAQLRELSEDHIYDEKRKAIIKRLAVLDKEVSEETEGIKFEQLRITTLFVDEAHNFKNITIESNSMVLGIARAESATANNMHLKIRLLRRSSLFRGLVFATGTPVTNSITDLYTLQTYLQPKELKFLNLDSFDNWALMFGEKTQTFEMDVDSRNYRMAERFNRFHNLPELTNIFAGVADFHLEEFENLFSAPVNHKTITVPRSAEQTAYIDSLAQRAEAIRKHQRLSENDNLLKVTVDGRKAALDLRLLNPELAAAPSCKISVCAQCVYQIYTERPQVTQLVFCDISTPKKGFNVYDELKAQLVGLGIPADEIAFIQTQKSDAARAALFEKVNSSEVKVLLGSTPMLGTGVNVQKRLFAVHHLDVPWRPSDMVQREGRMIRQGNGNDYVEIYRYVTDGSFDSYSWQLLESKQRFITQLLSRSLDKRDGEDVDSTVLDYAEVKAIAIGNPIIKERVQVANELDRLKLLKCSYVARRDFVGSKLENLPKEIDLDKQLIERYKRDYRTANKPHEGELSRKQIGEAVFDEAGSFHERRADVLVAMYRGMKIIVPRDIMHDNPCIYVAGAYEKCIRISAVSGGGLTTPFGIMSRIDTYLDGLADAVKRVMLAQAEKERSLSEAQAEFEKTDDLDAQIAEYTDMLCTLDIKLGVIKND